MPLSWNEIKSRAIEFSKEWENESSEDAEAKSFWDGFFDVFGLSRRRLAQFEVQVKKYGGNQGFVDLFWPGMLLVEHKSKGKSLEKAYVQAMDYFPGIKEKDLPKYVLVSDFEHFKLYDLEEKTEQEFSLKELHKKAHLFDFIAGYKKQEYKEEDEVNIKAAELMGKLYDVMVETGFSGHDLNVFLVRTLFCLFADDANIFLHHQFRRYLENRTSEDGSDTGMHLSTLFQILNTAPEKRQATLDEELAQFPYVNGGLFAEQIIVPSFNSEMRKKLLDACEFDWSKISPAIFGSLFQSVMDKEARRHLGAHYTSEKNILKLIKPLFLDELYSELGSCGKNNQKLFEFQEKLTKFKFLDPACGCGNFLVIAYRELRLLELEMLKIRFGAQNRLELYDLKQYIKIRPEQFFGIEIDEFPARIAQTAMWLMDHQMNEKASEIFGKNIVDLPLGKGATIFVGNALQKDWEEVVPKNELSYILGNPPFIGKKEQNLEQKEDMGQIYEEYKGAGVLDYVTAWYIKAAQYIQDTQIRVAFVSTNSISQGEQVGILWRILFSQYKIKIHFAHRTFAWRNEAKGNAAVHCVVIGFANFDTNIKYIFEYENIRGESHQIKVRNINPFLVEGKDITVENRKSPICDVPEMNYGSMPIDEGNLILSDEEKEDALRKEPFIDIAIKQYTGGDEFINNKKRWCLWLQDIEPSFLKKSIFIHDRIEKTRNFRLRSNRKATNKLAENPMLFGEIRQPSTDYIIIPKVSSENRKYVPIGILKSSIIVNGSALVIPMANLFIFGIMTSIMHMSWMKAICGRMKSDYQYSASIVYNNFPWPENPSEEKIKVIEKCAQEVLDVRLKYPTSSLADLYDPLTMPADLVKAHQNLDRAVDSAYGKKSFNFSAERMEFLFELYEKYTN